MTKSKKRASRFYVEQDGLYETSDLSTPTRKPRLKHTKALEAEKVSHQKIVAVYAPVDVIFTEEDEPATELWDNRIEQK
jgi:hypothetical protein